MLTRTARSIAVLTMAALGATLTPLAAVAAPTGTAMVQTQRMAGPTLNTTQNGWYAQGQVLSLVCHQRGQAVKGYYSPYIPGGWDDLWYKVSDGYWVADVDINTGSNDPVVPACTSTPAATGPTVMVQTQRMAGPTLNTTQNGWYAQGQVLSLVCHQRGQAVKGYYSPYIPGGWDDLWYKVSDGYWVADVDINTGSNAPVVGACAGAPAPPPTTTPAPVGNSVLTRAESWLKAGVSYSMKSTYSNKYGTYRRDCSGFVSMAWGLKPDGMRAPATPALPSYAVRITKDQLRPGDILLNTAPGASGHAAIFVRWANSARTRYISWEQNGRAGKTIEQNIPYPYIAGVGSFVPYRRK